MRTTFRGQGFKSETQIKQQDCVSTIYIFGNHKPWQSFANQHCSRQFHKMQMAWNQQSNRWCWTCTFQFDPLGIMDKGVEHETSISNQIFVEMQASPPSHQVLHISQGQILSLLDQPPTSLAKDRACTIPCIRIGIVPHYLSTWLLPGWRCWKKRLMESTRAFCGGPKLNFEVKVRSKKDRNFCSVSRSVT